jgi:glutathione S-transferase
MAARRLITIPQSHFCEKARWVLDATGVAYEEDPHAAVAHLRATRAVGGKSVPILVDGDVVLRDSTDIARHADALAPPDRRLVPPSEDDRRAVLAIEDDLDETLGPDARLLGYWFPFSDARYTHAFVGRMIGVRSPLAVHVLTPVFRALICRRDRIDAVTARSAEARVRSTFARLGEGLADAGYLVAGRFTLADLTFAALAAPLLAPPEHPISGRSKAQPPTAMADLRAELSATAAGRHALRVYRDHRKHAVS